MDSGHSVSESFVFPLVSGGIANAWAERFGKSCLSFKFRLRRIMLLILITSFPLLLLSMVSGHAVGSLTDVPLLHDPAVCARFLFVLPVLELAEVMVAMSLPVQARHFVVSEIVLERDRPRFDSAVQEVIKIRSSVREEFVIAILSLVVSLTTRLILLKGDSSNWESQASTRTLAGWWYVLVSLPILYFLLLRWLWIFLLWGWFLFRVSRLDLQLTPTHPDHAGGLGFLGWGLASFSLVLMAVSAVFSSGFFYQILQNHESLDSLKYHILIFVVIALVILYAPLLVFLGRLSRCRFKGLLDFSSLVHRYDRKFEEKWIERKWSDTDETLLGSPDIQSLAAIASAFGHVNEMLLLPFDFKGFAVMVAAALLPMIPLLATAIPLKKILVKLAELMV